MPHRAPIQSDRDRAVSYTHLDVYKRQVTSFVVDGNYIYYLQGGRLYKVFRWTGWETVVVPNVEGMHSLEYMSVI